MEELKYSKSNFSSNGSIQHEDAYARIKKLIGFIESFIETRAEDKIILINQYLQALSLTLNLSIFDPHTNIAEKLFTSLYNLMNILEPRSLTSWYCVDLLINACKNHTARTALIKTYQFLPCLARLMGDQISPEKKTRLLRLMQDITCGIKIHWQIPHITHLVSLLCKWVEKGEQDVATLSLGLLVNLCYKNVSTICILQRNIDLKKFIRMCLTLKGPFVEVYVCQMMIILENISGYIPESMFPKLIDCTFVAVTEAYMKNDYILLRHCVDFFVECVKNNHRDSLNVYKKFHENIEKVLDIINDIDNTVKDTECTYVVLEFINFLVEMKVPQISSLYIKLIPIALKWIQESSVSYQALTILKTIAVNTDKKDNDILNSLCIGLPTFLLLLNSCKDDTMKIDSEYTKRMGALLQLISSMIHVKEISKKLTDDLHEDTFRKIFTPLLGDDSPRHGEITSTTESVNLYVHALTCLTRLMDCDGTWVSFVNDLLSNKQIHVILAKAICEGPSDVKKLALDLTNRSCADGVSMAISDIQSSVLNHDDGYSNSHNSSPYESAFSLVSVSEIGRLNNVLEKVENLTKGNDVNNLVTSNLMELYNYKISYLAQAERAALASVEATTRHCSHLQHRISRLTIEQNQLQQSLYHTMQKLEESINKQNQLRKDRNDLTNSLDSEKNKTKDYHSALALKEKEIKDLETSLSEVRNKLAETTKAKNSAEEQHMQLQQVLSKVQENYSRLEKNLKKKEDLLQDALGTIANYSNEIADLENSLKETQKQLDETRTTLQMKSAILESITKMANSSQVS
ncbi:uncharacterized protein LOC115874273 isoform X2 [Sitophilus oryzae]|nr:uncharacterized protein LOC115874273 isoform X2 [Sitophilus oryzae]